MTVSWAMESASRNEFIESGAPTRSERSKAKCSSMERFLTCVRSRISSWTRSERRRDDQRDTYVACARVKDSGNPEKCSRLVHASGRGRASIFRQSSGGERELVREISPTANGWSLRYSYRPRRLSCRLRKISSFALPARTALRRAPSVSKRPLR